MKTVDLVVDETLHRGLDDWVPLDSLIWVSRKASPFPEGSFKELAMRALYVLIADGLATLGKIGDAGFEAWKSALSPIEMINEVAEACNEVDWLPQGGLFWISNTKKGDQRARARKASGG